MRVVPTLQWALVFPPQILRCKGYVANASKAAGRRRQSITLSVLIIGVLWPGLGTFSPFDQQEIRLCEWEGKKKDTASSLHAWCQFLIPSLNLTTLSSVRAEQTQALLGQD